MRLSIYLLLADRERKYRGHSLREKYVESEENEISNRERSNFGY